MLTEAIGWTSSFILLATLIRQVWTQWRTRSTSGVSRWLFVGQLCASAGFAAYSVLLHNWVFTVTNAALLVTGICGQLIYLRNRRLGTAGGDDGASHAGHSPANDTASRR